MRISDWSSDVCSSDLLKSTSGLLVRADGRRLDVLHVMRGSPAAATGWQGGEAICSIDGKAIPQDYRRSAIASWSVGRPGRTVALGLRSEERRVGKECVSPCRSRGSPDH